MFSRNHLIPSQYNPVWIRSEMTLLNLLPITARQIKRATAPRYHHRIVIGRPVKLRFGRPGTRVQETIHSQYGTKTHGNGIINTAPMNRISERRTNSHIPKSIESDPPPGLASGSCEYGTVGGPERPGNRPGMSPASCQSVIPSLQTSVVPVTMPLPIKP